MKLVECFISPSLYFTVFIISKLLLFLPLTTLNLPSWFTYLPLSRLVVVDPSLVVVPPLIEFEQLDLPSPEF